MRSKNIVDSFEIRNLFTNKKMVLYCSNQEYCDKLTTYLLNNSLQTFYFAEDFDNVISTILNLKPSFALISVIGNENRIIDTIGILREFTPSTHIILQLSLDLLATVNSEHWNVSGVISDKVESCEVLECLVMILNGFRFLGEDIMPAKKIDSLPKANITAQEQKIMTLIGEGITGNLKIAEILYLSPHTIKNHKDNLVKKLSLSNMQDLYFLARQEALTKSVS